MRHSTGSAVVGKLSGKGDAAGGIQYLLFDCRGVIVEIEVAGKFDAVNSRRVNFPFIEVVSLLDYPNQVFGVPFVDVQLETAAMIGFCNLVVDYMRALPTAVFEPTSDLTTPSMTFLL